MKTTKKAQGLPMHAIGIIIIGVIVLALILIFIFSVSGQGTGVLDKIFGAQQGTTAEASEVVKQYSGNFFK